MYCIAGNDHWVEIMQQWIIPPQKIDPLVTTLYEELFRDEKEKKAKEGEKETAQEIIPKRRHFLED